MRSSLKIKILVSLVSLAIYLSAFSQGDKIVNDLQSVIKKYDVVGLSVVVVKKGEIVYNRSLGLKQIATNTPLDDNTIFRIASISKSFSATSIMQLIEAGKLSLDDDFGNLVGFPIRNPRFPGKVITLKMIMSHTSSINDSQGYFNLDVINPAKNANWQKCYNNYEPGKGYDYCNLNFNMVGTVIEKLSGQRFDSYVKQHVLEPLSLYGGYCVDSLDSSRFATLYERDSATGKYVAAPNAYAPRREEIASYVMGYSTPIFSPTGGMKISALDLAKYMTMHMYMGKYKGTRIMSSRSAKRMQAKIADEERYGLAIRSLDDLVPGVRLKGHTGSAYGLYSAMFFHPKKKYGFVVITNGCIPTYTNGLNDVLRSSMAVLYNNFIR